MYLTLITPAASEVISMEEAFTHLRIDGVADSPPHVDYDLVESLVKTARQHLEGRDGWLGRAFVTQQWKLTLDSFPGCHSRNGVIIHVPLPPLQSVDSITYIDTSGTTQTLDAADYQVDKTSVPARIAPAYGKTWPSTLNQLATVNITFTAGYGNASAVPEPIKQAMLLLIGHFYEHREAVSPTAMAELPMAVMALCAPFRTFAV